MPVSLLPRALALLVAPVASGSPSLPAVHAGELGLPELFACGSRMIETVPTGDGLELREGFDRHALRPVPTASGARFEKPGDPSTWFWSKGLRGRVSLAGETLPECVPAGPFRASGNEPFWSLVLDEESLRVDRLGGEPWALAPPPAVLIAGGARLLEGEAAGRPLLVRIEPAPCIDTMTGLPRPATVTLELGGERLSGCGGDPGSFLRQREWRVASLDGEPLPTLRAPVTLAFATDGRFAGQGPCNRLLGSFRLGGEDLRLGPAASTMMACPEPVMAAERRWIEALEAVRGFSLAAEGGLRLSTESGGAIALLP